MAEPTKEPTNDKSKPADSPDFGKAAAHLKAYKDRVLKTEGEYNHNPHMFLAGQRLVDGQLKDGVGPNINELEKRLAKKDASVVATILALKLDEDLRIDQSIPEGTTAPEILT